MDEGVDPTNMCKKLVSSMKQEAALEPSCFDSEGVVAERRCTSGPRITASGEAVECTLE